MVSTKKHERTCAICGNKYKYCTACSEYDHMEPWHLRWCNANCKDIDGILSQWGAKMIDSETAAALLKAKDLSRKEYWPESYKAAYDQILSDVKANEPKKVQPQQTQTQKPKPKMMAKSQAEKMKSYDKQARQNIEKANNEKA